MSYGTSKTSLAPADPNPHTPADPTWKFGTSPETMLAGLRRV